MSVQHLTLYAEDFRVPPVLHVVQNDTGRTVEFLIADYEVPAGAGAWLWMEIPGTENKVILAGTVSGQKVTVDLTGASLAVAGKSDCMVQITSGGEFVKTFAFVTDIHETVGGETVTPEEEELFEDLMAGVDDKFADYEDEIDEDLTRMQNQMDEFIGAQGEHNETTLWSGTAYLVDAAITLDYVPDDYQEIKIYASGEWHSYKTSAFIDHVNGVTIKKSTLHSNGTPAEYNHAELSIKASYDHSDDDTTDAQKKAFTIYRHRAWHWTGDDAADATQASVDQNFDTSQSDQVTLVEIRGVSNNANAEVADARVGYDGTTYASLGAAIRGQVAEAMGNGISEEVKQALLNCFAHVAWDDDDPTGKTYYDALEDALYPDAEVVSISAVYTQSGTVYDSDSLNSLKPDLVVTATYSDSTTGVLTSYTLSGTLIVGTSVITASYQGKTATFSVTVTADSDYTLYDYVMNTSTNAAEANRYVDTGLIKPWGKLNLEFEGVNANNGNSSTTLIGANNQDTSDVSNMLWYFRANKAGFSTYSLGVAKQLNSVPGDTRAVCKYVFVDGGESYIQWDSTTVAVATKNASAISSVNKTLLLYGAYGFADGIAYSGFRSCKLGYVKFTDPSTNEVVHHFIPAKSTSANKYGFYDIIGKVFYPENGTGLTAGNWT